MTINSITSSQNAAMLRELADSADLNSVPEEERGWLMKKNFSPSDFFLPMPKKGERVSRYSFIQSTTARIAASTFLNCADASTLSKLWKSQSSRWNSLNRDPLWITSKFLSPEETGNALVTCKSWQRALSEKRVWKTQCAIQMCTPPAKPIIDFFNTYESSSVVDLWTDTLFTGFPYSTLCIIAAYEDRTYEDREKPDFKAVCTQPLRNAITPRHYNTFFKGVQVVDPIPLPARARIINNEPDPECPDLYPQITIATTHFWTYIPRLRVNGNLETFSINLLKKLARKPAQGNPAKFARISPGITPEQRNEPIGNPGWYLMRLTSFRTTNGYTFREQEQTIRKMGYIPPSGPEVILTTMMDRVVGKGNSYLFTVGTNTTSLTKATLVEDGKPFTGVYRWAVSTNSSGIGVSLREKEADDQNTGLTGIKRF